MLFIVTTHRLAELKDKADSNLSGLELSNKQLIQLQSLEDEQHWINDHMLLAISEQFPTCLTEASTMINQHKVNNLYGTEHLCCYLTVHNISCTELIIMVNHWL